MYQIYPNGTMTIKRSFLLGNRIKQVCGFCGLTFPIVKRCLSGSKFDLFERPYELKPLNEKELQEKFITGSGPGGQKINKVSHFCKL